MFASAELAARIEAAEARFLASVADALRGEAETDAAVIAIGGGLSAFGRPGSPLNKVVGVGFEGRCDDEALAGVEQAWRRRGEAVRVELSTLADPAMAAQLSARGYQLVAFENVLGRALASLPQVGAAVSGLAISVVGETDAEAAAWTEVAVAGFAEPDGTGAGAEEVPREVLAQVFGDAHRGGGERRYLARLGGVPAGAAAVRFDQGLAQLAGAATLPAFRKRGIQTALLAARLEDARRAGCDLAVVTTAPGSRSQENAQRHGFALLYARAILVQA